MLLTIITPLTYGVVVRVDLAVKVGQVRPNRVPGHKADHPAQEKEQDQGLAEDQLQAIT